MRWFGRILRVRHEPGFLTGIRVAEQEDLLAIRREFHLRPVEDSARRKWRRRIRLRRGVGRRSDPYADHTVIARVQRCYRSSVWRDGCSKGFSQFREGQQWLGFPTYRRYRPQSGRWLLGAEHDPAG